MRHITTTHRGLTALILLAVLALVPADLPAQTPAATAAPATLESLLAAVATYDGGVKSDALWQLRDYIYARKDDPAERAACEQGLLRFLKSPASPVARMAAARHLQIVAGESAVPALAVMLPDPKSVDLAIYALQQIPGAQVDAALVAAVPRTTGASKTAVIAALGARRAAPAVPALVPLLRQPATARAAAIALGRIGGAPAAAALTAMYPSAGALKPVVASALLMCAEQALAAGDVAGARALFETVRADTAAGPAARTAVWLGLLAADPDGAPAQVLAALTGPDADLQQAAASRMGAVIPPGGIGPICDAFPRLGEAAQVQVLAALTGFPPERVRATVAQAARSASLPVRLAAMKALEAVGDASVVSLAAETAATARGAEQTAARSLLGGLKGRAVEDQMLKMLAGNPSEGVTGELLLALADRRVFRAKEAVVAALDSASPRVRLQALRGLRFVGTPSDLSRVVDLLLASGDDLERAEAEKTVAALALKVGAAETRARALRMRMMTERDPATRARLLGVFPLLGDNSALSVLRTSLAAPDAQVADAAARALAAWPDPVAKDDLLRLATDAKDETHRLLALNGFIRLVGTQPHRRPESAVADLKTAAGLAARPEERKLVLGALGTFPCAAGLELARTFLADAAVKAEAQAAIDAITAASSRGPRR